MSRPDAERALTIYKSFGSQTEQVVQYLTIARQYESLTRLVVPKLKHAPTSLTSFLEEYLNDPDFDEHRREFLAKSKGSKGGSRIGPKSEALAVEKVKKAEPVKAAPPPAKGPAPDLIDFFDSIESNQQTMAQPNAAPPPTFTNGLPQAQQYQQSTGFAPQQTGYNPFLPNPQPVQGFGQPGAQFPQQQMPAQTLQPDFTGAGFGGYTAQPQQSAQTGFQSSLTSIPQNGVASFSPQQPMSQQPQQFLQPQQTSSNPFRQSMIATGVSPNPAMFSSPTSAQSTNPFSSQAPSTTSQAFHSSSPPAFQNTTSPVDLAAFQQQQRPSLQNTNSPPELSLPQTQQQELQQSSAFFSSPNQPQQASSMLPQRTGTNPFARASPSTVGTSTTGSTPALLSTPTGSTNPFRQSQFVNQQTGLGWQNVPGGQGTFAGYNIGNVDTVPIFPRPGAN